MALHNTSWLRDKTRDLLTRYRKQYLDYVIHCHGTLPLPAVGAQGCFKSLWIVSLSMPIWPPNVPARHSPELRRFNRSALLAAPFGIFWMPSRG